jgi:hypothetical protein
MGYTTTVLVMDGHSTDRSRQIADSFDVLFVEQEGF